jgi:hypothetical protein
MLEKTLACEHRNVPGCDIGAAKGAFFQEFYNLLRGPVSYDEVASEQIQQVVGGVAAFFNVLTLFMWFSFFGCCQCPLRLSHGQNSRGAK